MSKKLTIEDYKLIEKNHKYNVKWIGSELPNSIRENTEWLCHCGKIFNSSYGAVKCHNRVCKNCANKSISDGKLNNTKTNLLSKKFGKLTIIDVINSEDRFNKFTAVCVCDCGNTTKKRLTDIKSGRVRSCGCIKGVENGNWKGGKFISGHRWGSIKANARNRKITFNITIEQAEKLLERQNFKCVLSNVAIPIDLASLDRIDSKQPYVEGNIQWIHKRVNKMKQDIPEEEFLYWCKEIAKSKEINETT